MLSSSQSKSLTVVAHALTTLLLIGFCSSASAQIRLGTLLSQQTPAAQRTLRHLQEISGRSGLLVRRLGEESAGVPVGRSYAVTHLGDDSVTAAMAPVWSLPRRLLLDQARRTTGAAEFHRALASESQGAGQGVVIGIVDSGVDLTHPDLRHSGGASRVAWWLDFGLSPLGLYPGIEADFGCQGPDIQCAVLGQTELDVLASGERLSEFNAQGLPKDTLGHGTHVASLAAGNGASNASLMGIAPEATLIVVRVANSDALVDDLDVLLATRFIFERATELAMPAVVNLSLGGDFGPHDGSSSIGQALAELVGDDFPGRAIVVAGGNSGDLSPSDGPYPGPLGIHTQVNVPRGVPVRVPVLTPDSPYDNAGMFIWLDAANAESLSVGLETRIGEPIVELVRPGQTVTVEDGNSQISLINQVLVDEPIDGSERGVAILATGNLERNSVYIIRLEGESTVDLWVQSAGAWGPELGSPGALFSAAMRAGTISIPADHEKLIAVGASLNRTSWPSTYAGADVDLIRFHPRLELQLGSAAYFSSAGPSSLGALKPDILAPGAVIAGAMGVHAKPLADGRANVASVFFASPVCLPAVDTFDEPEAFCAVVDDYHGVTLGTSMAAPLVAGAVALLLEQAPNSTQAELRGLLMAGAKQHAERGPVAGAGTLDVMASLRALRQKEQPRVVEPEPRHSWLTFADVFARPNAKVPLRVLAHLRGADAQPVSAQLLRDLEVNVKNGKVTKRSVRAPGLLELEIVAPPGSGGKDLVLEIHSAELIVAGQVPIAVDRNVALGGIVAEGGCSLSPATESSRVRRWPALLGGLLLAMTAVRPSRRRLYQSAAVSSLAR